MCLPSAAFGHVAGRPGPAHPAIANVRLVDLDGDGTPEVVASDMRAGLVLAGAATKGAGLKVIADGVTHPSHIERVDLDKDGLQDLLLGNLGSFQPADHTDGAVVWLRRNKEGTYTSVVLADTLGRVADVRAAVAAAAFVEADAGDHAAHRGAELHPELDGVRVRI